MASLLARLFGLHRNHRDARFDRPSAPIILPTRDTRPIHTPPPSETPAPLKNWCHPFKDTQGPLAQLTHLANAAAGYYPIGRSGLFHGGVHFDSGTSIPQEQAVHCLADGEVVAFRVDTHSPRTRYFIDTLTVDKPFARNFVLVRHRLQPPKIQGSADTPPSLTFYSLYMHLRDWAKYHQDSTLPRPAYWPQSTALRVKQTVNDVLAGQSEPGLNVRHEDGGKVIDLLPRGAVVTVSGKWRYRMLEDRLGPAKLVKADGSLAGYIAASILQPVGGNQHRIKSPKEWVRVRAEPKDPCEILMELPTGTVVTVSGEGPFRKLERVNQYVHFNSLESLQEPLAVDRIVVLEQPVPIKAGDLIGHLGDYQDSGADRSEHKLHLEVFSGDDIDEFFEDSRAWAQRLPDKDKTWLKLARGTPVAAHQDHISASLLPIWSSDNPCSDADLLVPKSLLDGLPPERKIRVPTGASGKTYNWYRLDGLLHDADDKLLNGWVREEVGVTPWLSPWSWEGYEVIFDYSLPKHAMASFFSAVNRFSDAQHERFSHLAEKDQKGRMRIRLCDIIHRNCDGKMTADELQAALRLPAKAQAISQLVLRKESEWFYQEQKWDALDELLGHSGSTPHLNWVAEKQRIEQMGWWSEVAERVGLPPWGRPYHFHPVGLLGHFSIIGELINVEDFLQQYGQIHTHFFSGTPALTAGSKSNLRKLINAINNYYKSASQSANLYEISYMLATVRHETYYYLTGEFFSEKPEIGEYSYFDKYDPVLAPTEKLRVTARNNGNTEEGDGYKYRGRGCVHLTWKNNYRKFSNLLSFDFVSNPDAAGRFEYSVPIMIVGMSKGLFTGKKMSDYLNKNEVDYLSARRIINSIDKQELIASYAEKFELILKRTSRLSTEF